MREVTNEPNIRALRCGSITLHVIEAENAEGVRALFRTAGADAELLEELDRS